MINIRLGKHHNHPEHSIRLLEEIKKNPGCCDRVWFSSEYGFPLLETHEKAAELIRETAELYHKAGITVDLQISNTIGHGEYMKSRDNSGIKAYGLEYMVGHDGAMSTYCFCWNGQNFRRYTEQVIKIYAALQPDTIWIDDDMRPDNHAPVKTGCFCDECIKSFNRLYGSVYTRKELVDEICTGERVWRERWVNFVRKGIEELSKLLTDAALSVAPDTRMAIQYGLSSNAHGGDIKYILDPMNAAKRPPASRAGGGAYHDKEPYDILRKSILISLAHERLPDHVEYRVPEIENTPYVVFGKSNYGTMLESSIALAYGDTGLSYASMMTNFEYNEFFSEQLYELGRHRTYWQRLIDVNRCTYSGNIGIVSGGYMQKDDPERSFDFGNIPSLAGSTLTMIGFAESHESSHAPVFSLMNEVVDTMTDREIEGLFDRPIITDAIAIEKLIERSFGARLPITVSKIQPLSCREHLSNGFTWAQSCFGRKVYPPYILNGDCEALGTLNDGLTGEEYGVSVGIIKVGDVRWAVFGYSLWNDIVSGPKRDQIIRAINSIGKLPAYVCTHAQVTAVCRVTGECKTAAVSVVNISISPTPPLQVRIHRPAGKKFVFENADTRVVLPAVFEREDALVTMPGFVRGWDIATIFVE